MTLQWDVKPGHGLTRVLSFPSPSGWRDQMTALIGRREIITLHRRRGCGYVADRGACAAIEDTGNRISVQWIRRGLHPPSSGI